MMNKIFALGVLVFAVVVSVDISPSAYQMLVAQGRAAWVSDVYFT